MKSFERHIWDFDIPWGRQVQKPASIGSTVIFLKGDRPMRSARNWIPLMAVILLSFPMVSPVAAQEELTYASVLPLTGPFGGGGTEGAAGQRDSVALINQEGGINGKKLKYVVEDGQYKLDVAMAAFQKIMAGENPLIFAAESAPMAKELGPDFKN